MSKILRIAFVLTLILSAALTNAPGQNASAPPALSKARGIDSPAKPGSGQPNLYATNDGRVFLSWVEPAGENRHALRFASLKDDKWSEARTIAEGEGWFVNWADFPSLLATSDGTLAAHWRVKSGPDTYAYNINIALSTDGGKTWSKPILPHRDGTKTEHGFVSLLPVSKGSVGAIWLDGRNLKEGAHEGHGASNGAMTLRHAVVSSGGQLSEEALLDNRVCECCQTSAAMTSEGAIIVYRDRSESELRDISVLRFDKGKWTEPHTVHADGWQIEGCPVNGPSVDASERRVAVAWFTAPKEVPRVNVAFSKDAGATFGQPVRVDDGNPMGRVQVLLMRDGSALVSWLERTANGAEIRARRIRPDGSRDQAVTVAESTSARASGFPRMARSGNEVIFAWTRPGTPSQVGVAVLKFADYK